MDLVALAPRGVVGNEEERERSRGTGMALTGWHFSSLSEALEFEDFSWHFRKVWESVFKKRVPGNSEIVAFFGDFWKRDPFNGESKWPPTIGDKKGPSTWNNIFG